MKISVHLNDKFEFWTVEVNDKMTNAVLSAKTEAMK